LIYDKIYKVKKLFTMCESNCDLETCQHYKLINDDEEIKASICVDLKMLENYIAKHYSGQIGSFLDVSQFLKIKKLKTVWINYINRKKWRGGKKIPKIVLRDLNFKISNLSSNCHFAELKAIMRTMKENPSFEWDYKDRGDGKPRVKTNKEVIDEVFE